jgi:Ca2+-binding RTX toxin-like protein
MATIFGTVGDDTINAAFSTPTTAGSDTIYGLAGDDFIVRSLGNDVIDGGAGFDTLDFGGTANRVVVNAVAGTLRELSGITLVKLDSFTSIEEFRSGSGDDSLSGSGADENFRPGLGRDTVQGGAGSDTILYTDATSRVFVDLVRGFALDHGGNRDGLDSIESARTGTGNDVIRFGADPGFARGGLGNDTFISGWDGTSAFTNANGVDYNERAGGTAVLVDLAAGYAQIGAEQDTLIGIFATARGGAGNDTLLGNGFNNIFRPRNGADTMDGRGGFDRADYRDETGAVSGTVGAGGNGSITGSDGLVDTLISIEWVRGSNFNDTLTMTGLTPVAFGAYAFASGDTPTLEGWIGDDVLTGAAGTYVIARYSADQGGITVNLAAGYAIDHWGNVDTLVNIWGIRASAFDDVVTLGAGNEFVLPGDGTDIVDGGAGIDRVSFDGAPAAAVVDLAAGTAQDGYGNTDIVTNFEVVSGTGFDDQIFGNGNANWLDGGRGNDVLDGRGGNDTVVYLFNTEIVGGVYADLGQGFAYVFVTDVFVLEVDTLVSIEDVVGSKFQDFMLGDAGANSLYGHLGDDVLAGRDGADLLDGGDGTDTAEYTESLGRVAVNLALVGPQDTLGAGVDTLVSIENVIGTQFNDSITGNALANLLQGGIGNDALFGMDGDDTLDGGFGDDIMQGQGGTDIASYRSAGAGVAVSLALQGAYQNTVSAGSDYLNGIEGLDGSPFGDTLIGSNAGNLLAGGGGNDTIDGGAGNDTIDGGGDDDFLVGGPGTDIASYASATGNVAVSLLLQGVAQGTIAAGFDTLSGFEYLTGGAFNDTLIGNAASNTLRGGAGDDILEGGAGNDNLFGGDGIDLASYAGAPGSVTVTLGAYSGTVSAGVDYFTGIEGLLGSAFNDTLVGDTGNNVLRGGAGDDRLYGLAGNDIFVGGPGNDQYYGDAGIDSVDFSDAADAVRAILGTGGFVNTINYGQDLYSGIENLTGGFSDDNFTGDGNANLLDGRYGNDTLAGGAGDDMLLGGEGNDMLTGGLGADAIDLGTGFDRVYYQTAADSRVAAMDRITNFTQNGGDGFDRLYFENAANALFTGVTASSISLGPRVAIEAASTMDDLVAQLTGLAASTASTLSVTQVDVGFGGVAGRYVVVNDTNAAFDAATDMLIAIGMAPGSATNLTASNVLLF